MALEMLCKYSAGQFVPFIKQYVHHISPTCGPTQFGKRLSVQPKARLIEPSVRSLASKAAKGGQSDKCGKASKGGEGGKGGKCGKGDKKDNLTAVLNAIEDIRLEQRPIPKPGPGEVLLAMDCVGICGSDVHYLVKGRIGPFVVTKPMVMGHEASGVVAEVGKGVKHLKTGDRVAIEPGECCRICDFCKQGKYNLCPGMVFCATPPYDGNLTRYYKHAADFCFKLPDNITMEEGALLEPLSVGVAGCRRAELRLGNKVLILGAGPIGLTSVIAAKAWGAATITITDVDEHRLKVAKRLGATNALQICNGADPNELAKEIKEIVGEMPDKTIDCVGSQDSVALGVYATRSGGNCVIVGMASSDIRLPLMEALSREVDLRGVFRYCNDYQSALSIVATGKSNLKKLVTHHFMIEETGKAFDTARHRKDNAIKVMIHVQKRDANNKTPFDS